MTLTTPIDSPPDQVEGQVVMRAHGITKVYGVTHALKGVDFEVRAGEVTALFGENGAGKSTLMKILSGVEQPTSGTLELDGSEVVFADTVDAARRGIAIIHQELSLCPNLSVRDNIFIGREVRRRGAVDYRSEHEMATRLLDRLDESFSPATLVGDLRLGQQQIVEIARALAGEARVLIMDEPTSALSVSEVEVLFRVVHELKAAGVAIVYISHHLEEALDIADHGVVFRDGALVASAPAAEMDLEWVVSHMVGRASSSLALDLGAEFGEPLLTLRDVDVVDPHNTTRLAVRNVSLDVRAGEIVCLYGLMGAGRTELLEALAGRIPIQRGTVTLDGRVLADESIGERIDMGLPLVPEDRQRDGLVQTMSVGENISLASIRRFLARFGLSSRSECTSVDGAIADIRVKTASRDAAISSLSGGNQQKVVIGKVLLTHPKLMLLDEPSRGIDVGAKAEIFSLMAREARRGLGVLFATSEVGEALTSSHRILVMSKGSVVREIDPRTATREQVMVASGESAAPGLADAASEPGGVHD
ncbi:sugar ABC transporter ATP-binding protein [Ilumatobacter coccineus]|uniref:Sugar ABC transporter ATP-binding protein n=1 Tax=Ilumatobacter coccineus (strain NBRC 103263 / KCTC 29153 / YM16-304) TaxID=1313172 RepID=A0A6C7E9U2_ILUCY|nr:sugar ABC transporter ATP-binding protein [Ilumatobacter coccineus]BAN03487.1 sugar ABC transporter ATP-binding protein [Ilumatobacter coccineus YM16-304]